jgi:hypothetical protein
LVVVSFQVCISHAMRIDSTDSAFRALRSPEDSGTPKSAAWLLAEGAFAETRSLQRPATAAVIVRRSRVARVPSAAEAGLQAAPATAPADKGPRVFRVDAPRAEAAPAAAVEPPLSLLAEPLPALPVPRRQRIGIDRRPGPVLRLVPTPSAQPAANDPDLALQATGTPRQQATRLRELMAQLQATFDDIGRARSFQFAA